MTKNKQPAMTKPEAEIFLQEALQNSLYEGDIKEPFEVRLFRPKKKTDDLPERRLLSLDVDLAHRLYNWAYWNKIPKHKALDHLLITYLNEILGYEKERPANSDAFAARYRAQRLKKKTKRSK